MLGLQHPHATHNPQPCLSGQVNSPQTLPPTLCCCLGPMTGKALVSSQVPGTGTSKARTRGTLPGSLASNRNKQSNSQPLQILP